MGHEANLDSIRDLDEQIIKLKRVRNSLLNISTRVPVEILGYIFVWSIAWEPRHIPHLERFGGLQKGSHNFLLVCHHWFEVASRTPGLWNFWGNTLQDWKKRHHRSVTFPLDLVLDISRNRDPEVHFDGSLHSAVRPRVVQNAIRRVHLRSDRTETMDSLISSLTPSSDDDAQNVNIESIAWRYEGAPPVDISNFFTLSRLSKLRLLDLFGNLQISSWDPLASRITSLTALSLHLFQTLPLSTSQLFSILASNPNLQRLKLCDAAIPDCADQPTLEVPLPDLKLLSLKGVFRPLFGLLRRLLLPEALDEVHLAAFHPTVEDISRALGPYMRDYFRRDSRFQDKLHVSTSYGLSSTSISVGVMRAQVISPTPTLPSVKVTAMLPLPGVNEKLLTRLIAPIPGERVVSFRLHSDRKPPEELFSMMPNIEMLHLACAGLSGGFLQPNPDGPHAETKLLPSLRSLRLESVTVDDNDWGHLTNYLAHQSSDNQIISLEVTGKFPLMDAGVVDEINGLVEEFTITSADASYK